MKIIQSNQPYSGPISDTGENISFDTHYAIQQIIDPKSNDMNITSEILFYSLFRKMNFLKRTLAGVTMNRMHP